MPGTARPLLPIRHRRTRTSRCRAGPAREPGSSELHRPQHQSRRVLSGDRAVARMNNDNYLRLLLLHRQTERQDKLQATLRIGS
jgi:hypothetical protein